MKIQIIKLSEKYGGFINKEFEGFDYVCCKFINCEPELLCDECILNNENIASRCDVVIKEVEL